MVPTYVMPTCVILLVLLSACSLSPHPEVKTPPDPFQAEKEEFLTAVSAIASTQDANVASGAIDKVLSTRWSGNGEGAYLDIALEKRSHIRGLDIAFHLGSSGRRQSFDILVLNASNQWVTALRDQLSSGDSDDFQRFLFPSISGTAVRFLGHGNTSNTWNSLTEVKIIGSKDESAPAPSPLPPSLPSELDPSKAPGENFDLTQWKITLPVDSNGGKSGKARELSPIPQNFEIEPYFYTSADGGMVFRTPVDGARTSTNTKYTRTELREMDSTGEEVKWTVAQGGTLRAKLKVTELPQVTGGSIGLSRVVIGQIHGPDDELCRLYYEKGGNLYFADDKAGNNSSYKETTFQLLSAQGKKPSIPLNEVFSYEIIVDPSAKTLVVTVTDAKGQKFSASDPISGFWPGKALYFKAGTYVQVSNLSGAGSIGNGFGETIFYELPPPTHE